MALSALIPKRFLEQVSVKLESVLLQCGTVGEFPCCNAALLYNYNLVTYSHLWHCTCGAACRQCRGSNNI